MMQEAAASQFNGLAAFVFYVSHAIPTPPGPNKEAYIWIALLQLCHVATPTSVNNKSNIKDFLWLAL